VRGVTTNLFLSVSAWGFPAEREGAVREALEQGLKDERLLDDFRDRHSDHPLLQTFERLDGSPMLRASSRRAVVIAGSYDTFESRVSASLSALAAEAAGGPCLAVLELLHADDPLGAPDELAPRLHAVAGVRSEQVEDLRGGETRSLLEPLCQAFHALPAWEQRDAMMHLLLDYCEVDDPALPSVWRAMLDAPLAELASTGRHLSHVAALCGLSLSLKYDERLRDNLALTNHVVSLMRSGSTFAAAMAQGERAVAIEVIAARGLLPDAPSFEGPTSPFLWDAAAGQLTLTSKGFPPLEAAVDRLIALRMPCGGDLWKAMLATLLDERAPASAGRRLLLALRDSLSIEVAQADDVPALVAAARELFSDRALFARLLPVGISRLQAQLACWAEVDPIYGKGYEDALWFSLRHATAATLAQLAEHPEPGVVDLLLSIDVPLAAETRARLEQRVEQRRAALRGAGMLPSPP
jgi:hypothetical protein